LAENSLSFDPPEILERKGFNLITSGKVREGLKSLLQAAKLYEKNNLKEDAGRLYEYLGRFILERTGSVEKAKPSFLKAAYLYIDVIEDELARPEPNLERLDRFCSSVLTIFEIIEDKKNFNKYATEFASMFEELGKTLNDNGDFKGSTKTYELAYKYYKKADNKDGLKRIAEALVETYGSMAERFLTRREVEKAGDAFYKLAMYLRGIFGYDVHFMEMMDTAAKNYEKASKLSYSKGDLDGTTSRLVKAQYAYILARNFNRAKLIGINTVRMLNQVISSYRGSGDYLKAGHKLHELAWALVGIGKFEDSIRAYKSALESRSEVFYKIMIRVALLKVYAAERTDNEVLGLVDEIEILTENEEYDVAIEKATNAVKNIDELTEKERMLEMAEGFE